MSSKEPKIEFGVDKNLKGILVITCPDCGKKLKKNAKEISPGKEVACSCGFTVSFSGDDLRGVQRSLDDLKRTLKSIGK